MPARKAASSASSIRTGARLRERGRAISRKELRAFCVICKFSRAASSLFPSRYARPRWASGSRSRQRSPRGLGGPLSRCRPRWRNDDPGKGALEGSIPPPSTGSLPDFRTASPSCRRRTERRRRPRWRPRSSASTAGSRGTARARTCSPGSPRLSSQRARADLGLFEVDEGALPEAIARTRPRVVALGNLFRDQLDRYGELEIVAERWRPRGRGAAAGDDARRQRGRRRRRGSRRRTRQAPSASGSTIPSHARPRLQHAADSKYCVRCGAPYEFAAAYVGHLGDYRCPAVRARTTPSSTSPRATSSSAGCRRRGSALDTRGRSTPVELASPRALQRLQRVAAARARARRRRVARTTSAARSRAVQRGVRTVRAHPGGREVRRPPPDQEPCGRERGRAHARNRRSPRPRRRAQRRDRRRPGRVVDLGRRLRAAPRARGARDRVGRARGRARAAHDLRRARRGAARDHSVAREARSIAASGSSRRAPSSSSSRPTPRCSSCAGFSPSAVRCGRTGRSSA